MQLEINDEVRDWNNSSFAKDFTILWFCLLRHSKTSYHDLCLKCVVHDKIKLKIKRSEFNRFSTCIESKTLYCYFISKLALSLWRNGTNERILFIVISLRFNSIYLCNLNLNGNKACIFINWFIFQGVFLYVLNLPENQYSFEIARLLW